MTGVGENRASGRRRSKPGLPDPARISQAKGLRPDDPLESLFIRAPTE